VLGRHRPGLVGRLLGGQAVLLGVLGRAEGVAHGEQRQQQQREQADAALPHRQHDRGHAEDHGVGPRLGPDALLQVGDEVALVGQGGDQADQDQVGGEVDEPGDGEGQQVPGPEGAVTAEDLVDAAGRGHEQAVLADVEEDLLGRGPAQEVGDEHGQGQGQGGRLRAPAEQDGERERLGGRGLLGSSGGLGPDRQRLDDQQAGQQHPEQGRLVPDDRRPVDDREEGDQAEPDRRDGEHVGVQR